MTDEPTEAPLPPIPGWARLVLVAAALLVLAGLVVWQIGEASGPELPDDTVFTGNDQTP